MDPIRSTEKETLVVPVIEEELITGTRIVKTGSVRVRRETEKVEQNVELPSVRYEVEVTRVPVGRVVNSAPETREEDGILIIPVVEEEMVMVKRLVLKEEIRVRKFRLESTVTEPVTLIREHAVVERLNRDGVVEPGR